MEKLISKNIKKKNTIIWPIVFLHLFQLFFVNDEFIFLIGLIIYFIYTCIYKKVIIPRIPGLLPYITYLFVISIIGIFNHPLYMVIRDIFYEFSNIIFIILGYIMCKRIGEKKSLWTTLIFANAISSILVIIIACFSIMSSGISFGLFRDNFSLGVYSISILLPLLIVYKIFLNENIFSKKIDLGIMILWTIHILLNLSRTAIINVLAILFISLFALIINKKITIKTLNNIIKILFLGIILLIAIWNLVPKSLSQQFITKIENSFNEINSKNEFNTNSDAQSNWRGYEITCSKEFWHKQNFIVKIFGKGNGTIIPIHFIPTQWKDIVDIQGGQTGITVLHNTYYSLLCKGGVIAVILYIIFILRNISSGFIKCRDIPKNNTIYGIFIIGLFVSLIINSYVIRWMFQNDIQLSWSLLIGWISMLIRGDKSEKRIL